MFLVFIITLLCGVWNTGGYVRADGEDIVNEEELFSEEDLFSSDEIMVEEEGILSSDVGEELNKQSFGISGEITTNTSYNNSAANSWLSENDAEELTNNLAATIFLDARFKDGFKSFLSVEGSYSSEENDENKNTDLNVKEFFIDANWQNRVYFRTGKQVLKWGRSYFWNPTDLINIEQKDFFDMNKGREGTYGSKVHIPFGAEKNIYLFLGVDDYKDIDKEEIALAGKYEFLVGNTEMAFSAWTKEEFTPVYGFDISSRVFDIDLRGEISLSRGDNSYIMNYDTLEVKKGDDKWIPSLSAGFTKYFDYGDISDRISLTGEFYYNQAGYEENIFKRIEEEGDLAEKKIYMEEIYQPYMNSKYYAAFFGSIDKFIIPDLTLNLNGITNLVDKSLILTGGISYIPRTNVTIDFNINRYLGDEYTEATFSGNRYSVELGTSILF